VPGAAENLIRLPARECFDAQLEMPVNALPALGAGGVTFGSLNEPAKLNDRVLDCWARVLAAVPRSRLLVGKADSALFVRRVRERLALAGVAGERVEPVATLGLRDYVALHHRIDVLLDPFPYNGGTITCFALWMGVPVVSLTGSYGAARMGHALVSHVGLPELAAASEAQYVARCAALAGDLGALARLRQSLRARFRESPLGRARVVVGAAEAAFSALREAR
jgi:protein O-GlcNAc transferase